MTTSHGCRADILRERRSRPSFAVQWALLLGLVAACSGEPSYTPSTAPDAASAQTLPDAAANGPDLGVDTARDDAPPLPPDATPGPDAPSATDGPRDSAPPDSAVGVPAIEPDKHEFRPTAVGSTDTFTFMVVNHSGTITTLSLSVDGSDFALVPTEDYCTGAAHLGPGGFCLFDVQFRPLTRGMKYGTAVLNVSGQSVTAALTGTGTP